MVEVGGGSEARSTIVRRRSQQSIHGGPSKGEERRDVGSTRFQPVPSGRGLACQDRGGQESDRAEARDQVHPAESSVGICSE